MPRSRAARGAKLVLKVALGLFVACAAVWFAIVGFIAVELVLGPGVV